MTPEVRPELPEYFSTEEIAALWKVSPDFVRRIFGREEGVLVLEGPKLLKRTRRYTTLRIPRPVLERVTRRMSISPVAAKK